MDDGRLCLPGFTLRCVARFGSRIESTTVKPLSGTAVLSDCSPASPTTDTGSGLGLRLGLAPPQAARVVLPAAIPIEVSAHSQPSRRRRWLELDVAPAASSQSMCGTRGSVFSTAVAGGAGLDQPPRLEYACYRGQHLPARRKAATIDGSRPP